MSKVKSEKNAHSLTFLCYPVTLVTFGVGFLEKQEKKKRARVASHPECFHNGIILIVYVIQKSAAKVLLFSDICKFFCIYFE